MAYSNALYYIDPDNGSDATRTALTGVTVANPSGNITRCTKTGHGLHTGDVVTLTLFTAWLNSQWKITVVDSDNFDLDDATWQATADANGTATPVGGGVYDPWKTNRIGAVAANIQAGDEVRFKKSPAPASTGISARFQDNVNYITLNSALTKTIDQCELVWTSDQGANVVCTADTTAASTYEGTKSAKMALGAGATTGLCAHHDISSIDISAYDSIMFWIYSSVALAAGDFQILLDDTSGCVSPIESINIPAVTANSMTQIVIPMASPASCTAIISVGLKQVVDKGAVNISLDNIEACNASVLSFRTLIGKNTTDEQWFAIRSVVGTDLRILRGSEAGYYVSHDGTADETVTLYSRVCHISTQGQTSSDMNCQDIGTSENPIKFTGGWDISNPASPTQNGVTWVMGDNQTNGMSLQNYNTIEKIYLARFGTAFSAGSSNQIKLNTCGACSMTSRGVYFTSIASNLYDSAIDTFEANNTMFDGISLSASGSTNPYKLANLNLFRCGNTGSYNGLTLAGGNFRSENLNIFYSTGYGLSVTGSYSETANLHTKGNTAGGVTVSNQEGWRRFWNLVVDETLYKTTSGINMSSVAKAFPSGMVSVHKDQGVEGTNRQYQNGGEIIANSSEARGGVCAQISSNALFTRTYLEIYPIAAPADVAKTVTAYIKKTSSFGGGCKIALLFNGTFLDGWDVCSLTTSYQQFSLSGTPPENGVISLLVEVLSSASGLLSSATVSNPSGSITRVHYVGHGLKTGEYVTLSNFTTWLNNTWRITYVDADNFDLDGATWQSTADSTGDVTYYGSVFVDDIGIS